MKTRIEANEVTITVTMSGLEAINLLEEIDYIFRNGTVPPSTEQLNKIHTELLYKIKLPGRVPVVWDFNNCV